MGKMKHVLHDVQIPMGRSNFDGETGEQLPCIGTLCGHLRKNGCTDRVAVGLLARMGPRHHLLDGVQWEGTILVDRDAH